MDFYGKTLFRELKNGMRIYVLPRPGSNASVNCCIATGSIHEGELLGSGISHFLEHLLFQGCCNYPGHTAAETVEQMPGSINAHTSFDHTAVEAEAAVERVPELIRIIADMVRFPELPEAAFQTEREVIFRECDLCDDNPGRALFTRSFRHTFTESPIRVPVIGYRPALARVTRDMMKCYHQQRYQPHRIFWVVAGGVDPESVFEAVAGQLGDWQSDSWAEPFLPVEPRHTRFARFESTFADPLARLAVAAVLPGLLDRDMAALSLLGSLLGQGESSRFVRILEKETKLALHFSAGTWGTGREGVFLLSAAAQPKRLDPCLDRLLAELENLLAGGITPAELRVEKSRLESQTLLSMRTPSAVAGTLMETILAGGEPAVADRCYEQLTGLTCDEVAAAARKFLSPDRLTVLLQRPEPAPKHRRTAVAEASLSPVILPAGESPVETAVIRDDALPVVDFSLVLPGGSFYETAATAGYAKVLAEMWTAGAGRKNETALQKALDGCGAVLHVTAGRNVLTLDGSVPRRFLAKFLPLLHDMLTEPHFESAALERTKIQLIEEQKCLAMEPRHAALTAACRHFYGNHPYARHHEPDAEQWQACTAAALHSFYRGLWHQREVKLGFAGKITAAEAAAAARLLLEDTAWRTDGLLRPEQPVFPAAAGEQQIPLPREQCTVELFYPGVPVADEAGRLDLLIFRVAENGLSAPLFQRIREERHLAYATGVRGFTGIHPGLISLYAVTAPEQAAEAAAQLREEINAVLGSGLEENVFTAARQSAARLEHLETERCDNALRNAVLDLAYGRGVMAQWQNEKKILSRNYEAWRQNVKKIFSAPANFLVMAGGQSK